MLKRYTFWLWMAVVFMLLTGAVHSISLFVHPVPANEVERQLIELMTTYKNDFGAGFHPTMGNLFTALSSCFSLLCLLGGLTNAYLLKKKIHAGILKGFVWINLLVFGICFVMMLVFTFLPPIVLTGLIVLFLALTLITIRGSAKDKPADDRM
jgi:hypothetical protein